MMLPAIRSISVIDMSDTDTTYPWFWSVHAGAPADAVSYSGHFAPDWHVLAASVHDRPGECSALFPLPA